MSMLPRPPLEDALPAGTFQETETRDGIPTLLVPAASLRDVAAALRDHPGCRFDVLLDVTAADHYPRRPRFDVVYHLVSTGHRYTLRVRVQLEQAEAEADVLPTLSTLWPSANWQEREVWDLFGIRVAGHPNLTRLLTPDDWEGHPLRKDYPVQVKLPVKTYEPLELTEDEFRANVEADRRARRS